MISELLIGIFLYNLYFKEIPEERSTPQVLAESKVIPSPSVYLKSTDIQKPSPTSSPSNLSKARSATKNKPVKGIQVSGFSNAQVLEALNNYRAKNGVGALSFDTKLQEYAQGRVNYLVSLGKLDKHSGHKEFMSNNGFEKLGFGAVAENQSWNFKGDAKGLIESFYGKSSGHNKNQLSPEYSHVGIGISGAFTNLVFGGKKR